MATITYMFCFIFAQFLAVFTYYLFCFQLLAVNMNFLIMFLTSVVSEFQVLAHHLDLNAFCSLYFEVFFK